MGAAACGCHTGNWEEVLVAQSPHSCFQTGAVEDYCVGEDIPRSAEVGGNLHCILSPHPIPWAPEQPLQVAFPAQMSSLVFLHQSVGITLLRPNQDARARPEHCPEQHEALPGGKG